MCTVRVLTMTKCIQLTIRKSRTNLRTPTAILTCNWHSLASLLLKIKLWCLSCLEFTDSTPIKPQRHCGLSLKVNKTKDHNSSTPMQKPSFLSLHLSLPGGNQILFIKPFSLSQARLPPRFQLAVLPNTATVICKNRINLNNLTIN